MKIKFIALLLIKYCYLAHEGSGFSQWYAIAFRSELSTVRYAAHRELVIQRGWVTSRQAENAHIWRSRNKRFSHVARISIAVIWRGTRKPLPRFLKRKPMRIFLRNSSIWKRSWWKPFPAAKRLNSQKNAVSIMMTMPERNGLVWIRRAWSKTTLLPASHGKHRWGNGWLKSKKSGMRIAKS